MITTPAVTLGSLNIICHTLWPPNDQPSAKCPSTSTPSRPRYPSTTSISPLVSAPIPLIMPIMSTACFSLPARHVSFAAWSTSRDPWFRWSKARASRPRSGAAHDASPRLSFHAATARAAKSAMRFRSLLRGWCSQRIVTCVAGRGVESSSSP